jgi:CBS domain-containing protein
MEVKVKITDSIGLVLQQKSIREVPPIDPQQTVYEALELMAKYDVGALMAISDGRLKGIFSERDYARKVALKGHASRETKVSEIMTSALVTVTRDHTVDECMNLMTEHHIRHLPVLEGERVVGIISIGDLVKWVISGQAHAIEALEGYIQGSYPR